MHELELVDYIFIIGTIIYCAWLLFSTIVDHYTK